MTKHQVARIIFVSLFILLGALSFYFPVKAGYFVVLGVAWFVTVFIGSSLMSLNYHLKAYCSNPSEKRNVIALTFDDGPNEMTPKVLDILKKYNAKAAFFCIGKNIEKHPEILKRVVDEGHTVGNHTYSHAHTFDFYRKDRVVEELQKTDAVIERISGTKPKFFRPPNGVTNPSIARALTVTKHKVIGWNIRSMDGVNKNEAYVLNRITKRIAPGGIVLMHDTSIQSVHVLERLMEVLRVKNYNVVPFEEILGI